MFIRKNIPLPFFAALGAAQASAGGGRPVKNGVRNMTALLTSRAPDGRRNDIPGFRILNFNSNFAPQKNEEDEP